MKRANGRGFTLKNRTIAPIIPARAAIVLLRLLPEPLALRAGRALGWLWTQLGGARMRHALTNLRIAFPHWSEARRRRVLRASLMHLGTCLIEFARMRRLSPEALRARVRVEGMEHLRAAQARSPHGGVVVLTAHLGNWEFFASAMKAHGCPLTVVHRPRSNPWLEALMQKERTASGVQFLPRGAAARGALRALAQGRMLAMPYDQNCGASEGVFAPFFGRLACSRVGPVRLAMRSGAPVVPAFLHRAPDGQSHVCHFRPALEVTPESGDRAAATLENVRRWNRVVEGEIRACPEQWLWVHRRFRTQPHGEVSPYAH